jgi:hypothetical protein
MEQAVQAADLHRSLPFGRIKRGSRSVRQKGMLLPSTAQSRKSCFRVITPEQSCNGNVHHAAFARLQREEISEPRACRGGGQDVE